MKPRIGEQEQKVNWLRKQTLNGGVEAAISDKSGIVKFTLPGMNNRSIMCYADEFFQLAQAFTDIQRYLETHADLAVSRDVSKDARKAQQVQTRATVNAVKALDALGLDQDTIKAILAAKKQAG